MVGEGTERTCPTCSSLHIPEPSSAASSPEHFGPLAKKGRAAAEVSPAKEEESPRQASKKAVEGNKESSDEEQQKDLTAKIELEESSEEEEEEKEKDCSIRTSKVWEEESSEEEDENKKEYKGRARNRPVTKNKQTSGKASVSRKQAREESEDSEEKPAQMIAQKVQGNKGAKSYQESEQESEEEKEILAKNKEIREEEEEEEDWKPRARSNGGKRSAWEEGSRKQKSRLRRLMGDSGDSGEEKEKEAAGSGDSSRGGEEPPVQRKSKDGTLCEGGERQSGSSEAGEDRWKVKAMAKGTGKIAKLGSVSGEESDLEREVSDSEAAGSPKGERKNRSSKKSSKKGRTRSSSSSSDGSPEPKGGKVRVKVGWEAAVREEGDPDSSLAVLAFSWLSL